jgi:hypothetical protein
MPQAILGIFVALILSAVVFAVSLFFVALANILRLLPTLAPILGRIAWGILVLSCRVYYLLLTRLAPFIERRWKVKILNGLWRLGVTLVLSLLSGLLFLLLTGLPMGIWTVLPFLLHGLFVDFIWDDIPGWGELQMGVRL